MHARIQKLCYILGRAQKKQHHLRHAASPFNKNSSQTLAWLHKLDKLLKTSRSKREPAPNEGENDYDRTDFGLDMMGCLLPRTATQLRKQNHSDTLRMSPQLLWNKLFTDQV